MTADNDNLIAQLRGDPLRHITPLKMYALYGSTMQVLPVSAARSGSEADALLLVSPRVVSQYDEANYGDVEWVMMPALPAHAGRDLVVACVDAILATSSGSSFVVKTIDTALIDALRERLAERRAPQYRRALCTFGWPHGANAPADRFDASVLASDVLHPDALPLLRAHGVYSTTELETLFADGSARCHVKYARDATGANAAAGVLLTFPNTPTIHEIGSLHVRAHARRAGHARALLAAALSDLRTRGLTARYVVDASNTPSIALAEAVGLREQFRLAHWVIASA